MRNTHSIEKLLILLSVFLLSGCYKIMDYWPSQPPAHYRIKSVTFHEEYYGTYQGNFYYNRSGDPDSVIYGYVGTAFPNLYFSYNSKKQVSEIKAFYTNDGFDSWHRLGYNQKGLITTDTLYTWGVKYQDPEPSNYHDKIIVYFEYDNYNRITKATYNWVYPPIPTPFILNYSYNSNGNLITGYENAQYDNYTNPLTLHPIWQFLQRNYSINNPINAVNYNKYRLPLKFDYPYQEVGRFLFLYAERRLDKSEIVYEK